MKIPAYPSALALLTATIQAAGAPSIGWPLIGSGGSASGGAYAIQGSFGQPAASGQMSGGNYALTGGFTGIIAVVGPPLKVMRNPGGTITILWPSHFTAHTLEQSPDLTLESWTASAYPVTDNGVTRSITVTPPPARLFFRLVP